MTSLAELGEIAKSAPNLSSIKRYGVLSDPFGRKTLGNRRIRLKEAEAHHKLHGSEESAAALKGVRSEHAKATIRRVGSLGVGFGTPAAAGYYYGSKPKYGPPPQGPM